MFPLHRVLQQAKQEILEPVIQFPLISTVLFFCFFVAFFVQVVLVVVSLIVTTYWLNTGVILWLPDEFWELSLGLLIVTLPIATFFFLFMRFSWKIAKERYQPT